MSTLASAAWAISLAERRAASNERVAPGDLHRERPGRRP